MIWLSNLLTSSHFLYCTHTMSLRLPQTVFFFFYSTGQTLCEWPAGLTLSFTFHTCEEWMLLKVKLAPSSLVLFYYLVGFFFFFFFASLKFCLVVLSVHSFFVLLSGGDVNNVCFQRLPHQLQRAWECSYLETSFSRPLFFFFLFLQTTTTSSSPCSAHMSSHSVHYNPDELTTSLEHFTR